MLHLKHDVRAQWLQPEILLAVYVADQCYAQYAYECVITSLNDGHHGGGSGRRSRHYDGWAVDLRVKHLPDHGVAAKIATEIRHRLGRDYDVLLHPDHIHIEFDPKEAPYG